MKRFVLLTFFVCLPLCVCGITAPGITYTHSRLPKLCSPYPTSMHIVTIDPEQCELRLVAAHGKAVGLAPLEEIVRSFDVLAAVNASFFIARRSGGNFDGVPAHACKIRDGWLAHQRGDRGIVGWSDGGRNVTFSRGPVTFMLQLGSEVFDISHVNYPRGKDSAVLYTPDFYGTTQTSADGALIVVCNDIVTHVVIGEGDIRIPHDGYVLALGPEIAERARECAPGDQAVLGVTFTPKIDDKERDGVALLAHDYLLGGAPLLVYDGEIVRDMDREKISTTFRYIPHPRTAFGMLKDGKLVFVVIEGHKFTKSWGMTIPQLAHVMKNLGCVYALNLDGGSSSSLYVRGRDIVVSRSGPTPISDALVVCPRQLLHNVEEKH